MGMAASQARYLQLTARKTNTEYEGQQINQERVVLANRTADLFNQMLMTKVPTCPDSNDFTKLQYSWSDGYNDAVISDYYQVSTADEEYNYVVTSYHYENVYTGQSKRMNAPEIQASKKNNFADNPDKTYEVRQMAYHKESLPGAGDDSYTLVVNKDGVESNHVFRRVDTTIDSIEEIDAITKRTTKAIAGDKATYTPATRTGTSGANLVVTPASWSLDEPYTMIVRIPNPDYDPTQQQTADVTNRSGTIPAGETTAPATIKNTPYVYINSTIAANTKFDQVNFEDENQRPIIEQLLASYGDKYDQSKTYFAVAVGTTNTAAGTFTDTLGGTISGTAVDIQFDQYLGSDGITYLKYDGRFYPAGTTALTDATLLSAAIQIPAGVSIARDVSAAPKDNSGTPIYAFICGEDMDAASGSQGEIAKVEIRAGDKTAYYTDGKYVLTGEELSAIDLTAVDPATWIDDIVFHSVDNDPLYSNFEAVGNCRLTELSEDQYNGNEDISIEIQQVMKDMKENGNNVAYGNLSACFDPTTGEYLGGIYQFKMFDHTYYTTVTDLQAAVKGAWEEDAIATNGIDAQNKLCYYTSTYISTKIEDTKKALMETDGKGRFSSVKFEDDDTVYTLKCETITDDDAYQNAMNQYFYKQEKYDKAVSDINAKTEIIQAEDRELQLRLEQLGTEQTALQTEMEACQKVVSKNIEGSFKTFGG